MRYITTPYFVASILVPLVLGMPATTLYSQETGSASGTIEGGKLVMPPDQMKAIKDAIASQMGLKSRERAKTGRTVADALKSGKQYTTFVAIVERAGLMPLLAGQVKDSLVPTVTLTEAPNKVVPISSSNVQVQVSGNAPGMSETAAKSHAMDMFEDMMGDVVINIVAEEEKITVFAPTDAALSKLPKTTLDSLRSDSLAAASFVRAHLVNRGVYRDAFPKVKSITAFTGTPLAFGTKATSPAVNDVEITEADLPADNGVIHGISAILLPSAKPSTK